MEQRFRPITRFTGEREEGGAANFSDTIDRRQLQENYICRVVSRGSFFREGQRIFGGRFLSHDPAYRESNQPLLAVASPSSMKWYCIHTSPAKEIQIAAYLEKSLALEVYAPRIIQEKTARGIRSEVACPLFPRYLFCRLDLATHYHAVRSAPEVIDFVRFSDDPAIVNDGMIAQLRNWAGEGVDVTNFHPGTQPGIRVEISAESVFALPESILKINKDRDRVAILRSILEGDSRVSAVVAGN